MKHAYDQTRAKQLIPLLQSITAEVAERTRSVRRLERKLRALKREFQLLREQGRDTPADRRESDGRVARQAELLGQVEEAESTLAAEEQYHAVLESMLYARRSALDHATEELEDLRGWLKSFGRQREKLSRMGAELRYASWRERNSATLGREVFGQLHEIRSGLRSRRREVHGAPARGAGRVTSGPDGRTLIGATTQLAARRVDLEASDSRGLHGVGRRIVRAPDRVRVVLINPDLGLDIVRHRACVVVVRHRPFAQPPMEPSRRRTSSGRIQL